MPEILVVASKVKKYIKDEHDMNTSADTMDALTEIVRRECDRAAENAKGDKRKTVKEKDF